MALHGLGAIDNRMSVTTLGRQMLKFPLEPTQARVLTASIERGCTADVLDILSLVNDSPIFLDPLDKREEAAVARSTFAHRDGDHLTLLNVLRSYEAIPKKDVTGRKAWCRERFVNERNLKRAIQARDQMRGICEKEGVDWQASKGDDSEPILRCLVEGMFSRCAILINNEYRQIVGNSVGSLQPPPTSEVSRITDAKKTLLQLAQAVKIHPSSTLHNKRAPAILYDEIVSRALLFSQGTKAYSGRCLALPRCTRPTRTPEACRRSTTLGWPSCRCSTQRCEGSSPSLLLPPIDDYFQASDYFAARALVRRKKLSPFLRGAALHPEYRRPLPSCFSRARNLPSYISLNAEKCTDAACCIVSWKFELSATLA